MRRNLNIVAMVWVDGEYGLIKWKQQDHFDGKHSPLSFGNPISLNWRNPMACGVGDYCRRSVGAGSRGSVP